MNLPFDLPENRLPVIVGKPESEIHKAADETITHVVTDIPYKPLRSDRRLLKIGFMMNLEAFASLSAAERYTINVLTHRLKFSGKLEFPGHKETGVFYFVDGSKEQNVWAHISNTVIVTSSFTVHDLRDHGMALDEPDSIMSVIEDAISLAPNANKNLLMDRFINFKPPHESDLRRALKSLPALGVIDRYEHIDRLRRRAVFNMKMVAATQSGILRGMIEAQEYLLKKIDSNSIIEENNLVIFSEDITNSQPSVSTKNGKRRKLTRGEYQSKYHRENDKRRKVEMEIEEIKKTGLVTLKQLVAIVYAIDNPNTPDQVKTCLAEAFPNVAADPLTEIPTTNTNEEKTGA